ncbi:MAG: DUF1570 domain-containing protein [Planctomycetota bacterium]|jgi:hypothetical protein
MLILRQMIGIGFALIGVGAVTVAAEVHREPIADPGVELQRLGRLFGEGTFMSKSAHYLVVYDTPHAWADARVSLLEGMVQTFYREMELGGFDPKPLAVRQIAVLFNRHDAYLRYAQTVDGKQAEGTGGYYSSRTNRIAFFNNQTNPNLRGAAQQIEQLEAAIQRVERARAAASARGDANRAQYHRNRKQRLGIQLGLLRNRYSGASGRGDVLQTLHEAAHQLAYNSGITRRGKPYPFWIAEGLATGFETMYPAVPHGPRHDNPKRRADLERVRRKGAFLPIRELVTAIKPSAPVGEQEDWYAQAWGLFHYLYRVNTPGLRRYIQEWGATRGIENDVKGSIDLFQRCFGDLDRIHSEWRAFIREFSQR